MTAWLCVKDRVTALIAAARPRCHPSPLPPVPPPPVPVSIHPHRPSPQMPIPASQHLRVAIVVCVIMSPLKAGEVIKSTKLVREANMRCGKLKLLNKGVNVNGKVLRYNNEKVMEGPGVMDVFFLRLNQVRAASLIPGGDLSLSLSLPLTITQTHTYTHNIAHRRVKKTDVA